MALFLGALRLFRRQSLGSFQFALALGLALKYLVLLEFYRCGEKSALCFIEPLRIGGGPFTSLRQTCATIQRATVAPQGLPFTGGVGEMTMHPQPLAVLH